MTGEQLSASVATSARQWSARCALWCRDTLSGLPAKKIHDLLCIALVVWVLYGLVQLVAVFFPSSATGSTSEVGIDNSSTSPATTSPVDIAALQALHVFGVTGAEPEVAVKAAPVVDEEAMNAAKTQLNLTLEGIVYSPNSEESVAVIVSQGKQDQFHIGDEIPSANGVTLARVLLDRVILNNNGKLEALWLYDDSKSAVPPVVERPPRPTEGRVADMRENGSVTDLAQNYRDRLYKNPASLAEVIRITPEQKNGQLIGYRISPGKDREQFEKLGLKANDVVTSINNISLNEPSNALEIYKLMRSAKQASFTLSRNGQPLEMLVSLSDDD